MGPNMATKLRQSRVKKSVPNTMDQILTPMVW